MWIQLIKSNSPPPKKNEFNLFDKADNNLQDPVDRLTGISWTGEAVMRPDSQIPPLDFFTEGKTYVVKVSHVNSSMHSKNTYYRESLPIRGCFTRMTEPALFASVALKSKTNLRAWTLILKLDPHLSLKTS